MAEEDDDKDPVQPSGSDGPTDLTANTAAIDSVASALGVPATAIVDILRVGIEGPGELGALEQQVFDWLEKLDPPGPPANAPNGAWDDDDRGRIPAAAAIGALAFYNAEYPNSDPLQLKQYDGRPALLLQAFEDPTSGVAIKIAGVLAQEAQNFLETALGQDGWSKLTSDRQAALIAAYAEHAAGGRQDDHDDLPFLAGDAPAGFQRVEELLSDLMPANVGGAWSRRDGDDDDRNGLQTNAGSGDSWSGNPLVDRTGALTASGTPPAGPDVQLSLLRSVMALPDGDTGTTAPTFENLPQPVGAGGLELDAQVSQLVQALASHAPDAPSFETSLNSQAANDGLQYPIGHAMQH